MRRVRVLDVSFKRDLVKKEYFAIFMIKLFDNDYVEKVFIFKLT